MPWKQQVRAPHCGELLEGTEAYCQCGSPIAWVDADGQFTHPWDELNDPVTKQQQLDDKWVEYYEQNFEQNER